MGRTIPSFRIALESEIASWTNFKRGLGKSSRKSLEELFNEARNYCSASSNAVRPIRFEGMLMAIAFDHAKRLENIAREIEKARLETDA